NRQRRRCLGVHHCRRDCRSGRHGQFRRSLHLVQADSRHRGLHATSRGEPHCRPGWQHRHQHAGERVGQLLVALDVESGARALELATTLRGSVDGVKLGSRLFTLEGPALVRRLTDEGARVFLDLKFHDIPNTVAQAVEAAVVTGAWMINVHASGGVPMMQAAAKAAAEAATRSSRPKPLVIGVTVLTSMDEETLRAAGVERPLFGYVIALARLAPHARA